VQRAWSFERFIGALGGAVCVALAAVTWRGVSTSQSTWPFPALYFVELMALGVVVAGAYVRPSASQAGIAWAAAGAVTAFSILAAWTVGLLFLPAAATIAAAALITDVRHQGRLGAHVGIFVAAALIQAALIVGMAFFF
jgi:hypothetical protein